LDHIRNLLKLLQCIIGLFYEKEKYSSQEVVAYTCNPSTLEAEIRRMVVLGQSRQKVSKILISTNSWAQ
jgi:hypothetical protein